MFLKRFKEPYFHLNTTKTKMKFFVILYAKYVVCPLLGFLKMTNRFFFKSLLNLLPCVLVFGPWGMWGLSSLTRDRICTWSVGRWSLSHWTVREAPGPLPAFKQWNDSHVIVILHRSYFLERACYWSCVLCMHAQSCLTPWDPKDCSPPVWVEAGSGKESWGWNEKELVDQTSNVPRIKEEPVLPLIPSLWPQKW